jgi:hypothetical protein
MPELVEKQEYFTEVGEKNTDWLTYKSINYNETINNTINNLNLNLITDISSALDDITKVNPNAFVLMGVLPGSYIGAPYICDISASSVTLGDFYPNANLSWYNILSKYHTYFASAETGVINGGVVTFDHIKEFLLQDNVRFHLPVIDELVFPLRPIASWTATNCTLLDLTDYVRYSGTSDAHYMSLSGLSVLGSKNTVIRIKYRSVSGVAGKGWEGFNFNVYYSTGGHAFSSSYRKGVDITEDGKWHVASLDMSALDAGGTDWITNTITGIRFDLGYNNGFVVDIAWIGVYRTFDWKKPLSLLNVTGWIRVAEYEPESGMISVNVGFSPDDDVFLLSDDDIIIDDLGGEIVL